MQLATLAENNKFESYMSGDIALLRGVRERLDVSEQRLRSAEEELGLQRDKFAADIRAASSDFEARLGTQKATTDLTIAQLVKERDELLAMGVGSRFGQFVELKVTLALTSSWWKLSRLLSLE
jgi:hypothetical protein